MTTATIIETDDHCAPVDASLRHLPRESVLGGDPRALSWEEYAAEFTGGIAEAVRACIEANRLVGKCANEWCNEHAFLVTRDDGTQFVLGYSWRAWGDLMQAIVDRREGYARYYYAWKEAKR